MDSHALPPTHPMGSTHIVGSGIVGLATAISLTCDAEAADIITRHDKQVRSLIDVSESKEMLDFKEIETCPQPVASVVTLLPRKTPLTAFAGTGRRQHLQCVQSLYRRPSTATGGLLSGTLTRARQMHCRLKKVEDIADRNQERTSLQVSGMYSFHRGYAWHAKRGA